MGLKLFALHSATNVEYKTIFLFHFCLPLPLICIACCIVVKKLACIGATITLGRIIQNKKKRYFLITHVSLSRYNQAV